MKEVGEYYREKMAQYRPDLPEQGWERVAKSKEVRHFNKVLSYKRVLYIGLVSAVIITSVALFFIKHQNSDSSIDMMVVPVGEIDTNVVLDEKVVDDTKSIKETLLPTTSTIIVEQPKKSTDVLIQVSDTSRINTTDVIVPVYTNRETASVVPFIPQGSVDNSVPVSEIVVPSFSADKPIDSVVPSKIAESEDATVMPETSDSVIEQPKIFVPNAFTPDGDGLNDVFKVSSIEEVTDFDMIISDRKGQVLFRSKDIHEGWNGEVSGSLVQQGSYIYVIMYRDKSGYRQILKGLLVLIR